MPILHLYISLYVFADCLLVDVCERDYRGTGREEGDSIPGNCLHRRLKSSDSSVQVKVVVHQKTGGNLTRQNNSSSKNRRKSYTPE